MTDPPPIPSAPGPVVCLGEALVDLICEHRVASPADADMFVPHPGGAVANVAVTAARLGAHVALAGGTGDDAWGAWLRDRLAAEGVGVSRFALVADAQTPVALITVDGTGEPSYALYGEGLPAVQSALGRDDPVAVIDSAGALFFGSNTLVAAGERDATMRVREAALDAGVPVVFDVNLRSHRWRSQADAAASANACVPGALLVRCNEPEAALMTGEDDPERAASALVKAGARLVVVTLGAGGAILRGELRVDVPGVLVSDLRSTMGAGDALTGVLLARFALSGFYPPAVAAALREAVAEGARACERWSALA